MEPMENGPVWDADRTWTAVHAERARLAANLEHLSPKQWRTASLCTEWTVEETLAHLTAGASTGRLAWLRSMVSARFDAGRHNARRLREHLGSTPADTWARFAAVTDSRVAPTGDTWAWLGEVVVHGTDIRVPLDLPGGPDPEAVAEVARRFAARDFAVDSARLVRGLSLAATDADVRCGAGPEVRGPVLSLVMAMAGRPYGLAALEGNGVPELRRRIDADG